jgi:hypothetical protein
MSADGQEQKLARQIDGHGSSSIWNMTTVVTGPVAINGTLFSSKSSRLLPMSGDLARKLKIFAHTTTCDTLT